MKKMLKYNFFYLAAIYWEYKQKVLKSLENRPPVIE